MKADNYEFDFFLCSSSKDDGFAQQIIQNLNEYHVFYPGRDLQLSSGEMFFDAIAAALTKSRNLILIITPNSLRSKWVKIEYQSFFSNFFSEEEDRRIYLLEGEGFVLEDVPIFLRNFQISGNVDQITAKVEPGGQRVIRRQTTALDLETPKKQPGYQGKKAVSKRKTWVPLLISVLLIIAVLFLLAVFKPNLDEIFKFTEIFKTPKTETKVNVLSPDIEPEVEQSPIPEMTNNMVSPKDNQGLADAGNQKHLQAIENEDEIANEAEKGQFGFNVKGAPEHNPFQESSQFFNMLIDVQEINFPNGNIYKGEVKDGALHGKGIYAFKVRSLISKNDPFERYAEPGNYLRGEWNEGELYYGDLYDSKGAFISKIVIGKL